MVSKEAFKNGILSYLDSEIIPHLSNFGRWGLGAIGYIITARFDNIIDLMNQNKFCESLGVIDEKGMIDVELLADSLIDSSEKYGKLTIEVPILGSFTFSKDDVVEMRDCILRKETNA